MAITQDRTPTNQSKTQDANSINLFEKSLAVYQKLVTCEYHDHKKISHLLHKFILQHCGAVNSLRLLDLGCGDGSFVPTVLFQGDSCISLSSYTGVDLSAISLKFAVEQRLPANCHRVLVEQDMLSFLQPQRAQHGTQGLQQGGREGGTTGQYNAEQYDVILGALALHHIPTPADKLELLSAARAKLAPGGCMLIMDVFRKEGESREQFMERAHGMYFGTLDQLTPEEAELIWGHVSVHDFPETESEYRRLAAAAGFKEAKLLHVCQFNYTKVLALCT